MSVVMTRSRVAHIEGKSVGGKSFCVSQVAAVRRRGAAGKERTLLNLKSIPRRHGGREGAEG